ncbi:nickel/cobalt transporter [Escherichia coli]|uniref:nickel/cobalt transporter n=3 Tax=Escherichia coli TaxID=562 RepID=UPI000CFB35EE|nr:nickel/cobalt transporter [Escherichia coli]
MSVIFRRTRSSPRWYQLWPLAFFLLLVAGAGFWLWRAWPQVLLQRVIWQRTLNAELSMLLQSVENSPSTTGLSLLGFSFVYGILHALGPGHGKIVITTWLATHPSKLKSGIGLSLTASLLQGIVAITLVTVVLSLLRLPAGQLHLSRFWMEKGSYLLVGALGLLLCLRALKKLRILLQRPRLTDFRPYHIHHANCGCGNKHLPAPEQLQRGEGWRAKSMIVLLMGMRPCSGAIMLLLFSKVIGVFSWGVAAVMAMAAGTSLTISSLALLVHSCRQLAVRLSANRAPVLWRQAGWATLMLTGGLILLAASLVMWGSTIPQDSSLRPSGII